MKTIHFCTYRVKNSDPWVRSKDYESVPALMQAMTPYVTKHPTLQVTYQYYVQQNNTQEQP